MNKDGGIGATANFIAVTLVAIMVLAIIAPVTTTLFVESATAANSSGLEKVVIEHYNVIILLALTLILLLVLWVTNR